MTDMIDLQRALVANHIADLERERAALRAERARDHVRGHLAAGTEPIDEPIDHVPARLPRRARIGSWLVSIGQTIAGPGATDRGQERRDDPCADRSDRLPHTA